MRTDKFISSLHAQHGQQSPSSNAHLTFTHGEQDIDERHRQDNISRRVARDVQRSHHVSPARMPATNRYVVRTSGHLELLHSGPNRLGCALTYGMDLKEAFIIDRGSSQNDPKRTSWACKDTANNSQVKYTTILKRPSFVR